MSLFFTESPTNPLFRCVDIELVSKLCHNKGTLVCVDSTFASPINQKALTFGADLVLHSATKFLNGHNDVRLSILVSDMFFMVFKLLWFKSYYFTGSWRLHKWFNGSY